MNKGEIDKGKTMSLTDKLKTKFLFVKSKGIEIN